MRIRPDRRTRYGLTALLAAALLLSCTNAPHPEPSSAAPVGHPVSPSPASSPPGSPTPSPSLPPRPATSPSSSSAPPPPAPPTGRPSSDTPKPPPTAPATPKPPPAPGTSSSVVRSTASGGRTVALTFDDGPGAATGAVLDLLARYGARATFCVTGRNATAHPAAVKRIRAEGHRLCDHSVNHPQPFAALPRQQQEYEITAAEEMIVGAGGAGTEVAWFRAPGGAFTADNQLIAAQHGLRPLGWSVDPRDWARPGTPAIVATVQRELRPGGVVLLHDAGGDRSQTVAALGRLLPWLIAQGYAFDFPAV
ncbi:polysaccharide deacetylase family protein [Kitasatospora sp. NPDC002040]|uniref:polysaccharide deacetylase family protein n=1 Tax=Kitasatospora sp. NPDC002040 TaxID=3154661 RepID=UPI00331DCDF2